MIIQLGYSNISFTSNQSDTGIPYACFGKIFSIEGLKGGSAMKKILLIVLAGIGWTTTAHALVPCNGGGGNTNCTSPSHYFSKVFEVRVSTNANCTGMISVFKVTAPTAFDLDQVPTFGNGALSPGTYRCLAVHTGDIDMFVPSENTGACVAGNTYTWDTFQNDPQNGGSQQSIDPDGNVINSHGTISSPSEDDPWSYFSTAGSNSNNGYTPTTPVLLTNPLVVNGNTTSTLVVNYDNTVGDDNYSGTHYCIPILPPKVTFR
jgi:hypothetical protein